MTNITDAFTVEKLSLNNTALVVAGTDIPTTTGYEAPMGSMYINTNTGIHYIKFGLGDTDWNSANSVDNDIAFAHITGFKNRYDSVISFDFDTRTFTIAVEGSVSRYEILIKGASYHIDTTKTLQIPNTSASYFIYFDTDEELHYAASMTEELFPDKVLVAYVCYDSTISYLLAFGDERHGLAMAGKIHYYLHNVIGTRYAYGLQIGGTYVTNVNNPTDEQLHINFANGAILDEDLTHNIVNTGDKTRIFDLEQALNPIAQVPVYYRTGSTGVWRIKTADNFPFIYSGTAGYTGANGRIPFNEWTGSTWQLTQLADKRYVLVHIFASHDVNNSIFAVQGITSYNAVPTEEQATTELQNISVLQIESVPIASFVVYTQNPIDNSTKGRYTTTAIGTDYYDWKRVSNFQLLANSTTITANNWKFVSENYTAINQDNIVADTILSGFTITLPSSPIVGNAIRIKDSSGTFATNNLTIGRNGSNIIGIAEDLVIDVNHVDITLVYQDSIVGWSI